jgi:hypothetical protein
MSDINSSEHLKPWSRATYRIEVEGRLSISGGERYTGMQITTRERRDGSIVTCMTGQVMDQSELTGMLDFLAEMHLPILKVENLNKK